MENKENQASLQTLFYVLRRKLLWMILFTVLAGLASGLVTMFLISPKYSSTAKFYVFNDNNNKQTITSHDINAAQSLVDTYIVIIKSDSVLSQVASEAGVNYSSEQLLDMMKAGSLSGTEAFYITVSSTDKSVAYKITDAFTKVFPQVIKEVVKAGGVSVFDAPRVADKADSPNMKLNVVIGCALGLVLSFLVLFLKEVLDTIVYTEDDLRGTVDYPVIGVIPTIYTATNQSGKKGRRAERRTVDGT